jgi:hypothetical protein
MMDAIEFAWDLIGKFMKLTTKVKLVLVGGVVVLAIVLSSVAYNIAVPERTAATFCKAYASEKAEYLKKYNIDTGDGLTQFVNSLAAMSALPGSFRRMAIVAPDEIQGDLYKIATSIEQQQQAVAGNPLNPIAGFVGALLAGSMAIDSWTRVNDYVANNCTTDGGVASHPPGALPSDINAAKAKVVAATGILQVTLKAEEDLTYSYYFDEIENILDGARSDSQPAAHNEPCDIVETVKFDRDDAEYQFDELERDMVSSEAVQGQVNDLSAAVDALKALEPSSPELSSAESALAEGRLYVMQIQEANAKAGERIKELHSKFKSIIRKAKDYCESVRN